MVCYLCFHAKILMNIDCLILIQFWVFSHVKVKSPIFIVSCNGSTMIIIYLLMNLLITAYQSIIYWFAHSISHSFIHSLIHSCTHSFIHSFIHALIDSFIHSFIILSLHLSIQPSILSLIHPSDPFHPSIPSSKSSLSVHLIPLSNHYFIQPSISPSTNSFISSLIHLPSTTIHLLIQGSYF